MKILAGVYTKDAGTIQFQGKPVEIANPKAAQNLGIGIIHQELNLMQHLTAAQNIFIGREPRRMFGLFLDEKKLNASTQKLFDMLKLELDPAIRVMDLVVRNSK